MAKDESLNDVLAKFATELRKSPFLDKIYDIAKEIYIKNLDKRVQSRYDHAKDSISAAITFVKTFEEEKYNIARYEYDK